MNTSAWFLPLGLVCFGLVACGGTAFESSPDGTGGTGAGGSGTGSSAATGGDGSGTGGDGTGCCLAAAICNDGDTQIASEAECPPGATCYSNSICCHTVWCAQTTVNCDAIPVCEANETEVSVCPDGETCHLRTMCGSSVICLVDECDPDAEPNREYIGNSPEECTLIDFGCSSDDFYFANECGCGCEKCPDYIDCMPKSCPENTPGCVTGTNPLCSSNECPNSPRVY
jgi:hypothetical protein